ncbi:MFS transporter [Agilicoccus flavus]|uniref:MFS transporter n=1 Tax=Agilicoccus flavus TaxID=2775968 RepID=UPI001CF7184D|nr:MFS transporter [Agilicoccus flavus]
MSRLRGIALAAGLGLALLAAALDQSIVATALPTIVDDLAGDAAGQALAWVATSYVLAATLAMPVHGRIGDRFGRRRALVGALAVFLAGSIGAALAPTVAALVATRFVQGLGGGGLLVLVQACVADVVPERSRAPYLAAVGAVFAMSSVAGPPLGGWLAEGPGWRWAFWLNVPIALAGLAVVLAVLAPGAPARASTDDARGAPGAPRAWWRRRNVRLAMGGGLVLAVVFFGVVAYVPAYLQYALGLSPSAAGRWMLVLMGGLGVGTLAAAGVVRVTGRYRRLPLLGAGFAAAGLLVLSTAPPDAGMPRVAAGLALVGLGIGVTWDVLLLAVQADAPADQVGTATAAYGFAREVGVTIGTALVGTVFASRVAVLVGTGRPAADDYSRAFLPILAAGVPILALAAVAFAFLAPVPLARRSTAPADRE